MKQKKDICLVWELNLWKSVLESFVYFCSFYLWKREENEKLLDSDGYGLSELWIRMKEGKLWLDY